ncbi:MAG TPA: ABC transporter permease [Microthrixaceae bacterium]|jgi:ABC-2 type transport system permease protein|nr:ABC transporter permease [Microthrixaceae bacterium]
MTASVAAGAPTRPGAHEVPTGPVWFLRDTWAEASRHLIATIRNPDLLVFAAIQPVMFVVLFVYVFGGAIQVPGFASYEQFVLPGIFAQTVLFGSAFTGIGIAEDMSKGFIDRLRSLPMHQSAVLVGRTVSDLVRNVFTFVIMLAVGLLVGFRLEGGIVDAVIATLLLLAFAFAFSWIQALIGLSVRSVEAANSAGFIWMFPMTFVSSGFVSPETMPDWLQRAAELNPFSIVTNATRALYNGHDPGADLWWSVFWAVAITAVFSLLAFRKFSSTSR